MKNTGSRPLLPDSSAGPTTHPPSKVSITVLLNPSFQLTVKECAVSDQQRGFTTHFPGQQPTPAQIWNLNTKAHKQQYSKQITAPDQQGD
jgi:hypothetical protein